MKKKGIKTWRRDHVKRKGARVGNQLNGSSQRSNKKGDLASVARVGGFLPRWEDSGYFVLVGTNNGLGKGLRAEGL